METKVFDKAKWHYGGNFPAELDAYQGYIHTGFFLGWLINNNLISDWFIEEAGPRLEQFKSGDISSVKVYQDILDGVFTDEELNEEGFAFANAYFDFKNGLYLADYEEVLAKGLADVYYVQDTPDNFKKIEAVINKRYQAWKKDPGSVGRH